MRFHTFLCVSTVVVLLVACSKSLSPEDRALVQTLRTELEVTKREITAAELQNAAYTGGMIKALVTMRLEFLKTNEALIQQRIQAVESGTKISVETVATKPDAERAKQLETELAKQEQKATEAEAKAGLYSGGLIGVMALMGAATERNSVAMLRQQYLIAKYGLASPALAHAPVATMAGDTKVASAAPAAKNSNPGTSEDKLREQILDVTLLRKEYAKQDYQDFMFLDTSFNAKGLDKPARAIKGTLRLTDLFGEQKFGIKWTIDKPIAPGDTQIERGSGFKYNQFTDSHQWVRATAKENMKAIFRVDSILYEDGTMRNFD